MVSVREFQREALEAFREKVVSHVGDKIEGPVMFNDISEIERILADLAEIGRYVIVDFTAERHFDNFSAVYRKGDFLYIAWYESEARFEDEPNSADRVNSRYLKFRPRRMMINASPESRRNHIVIETDRIQQLPVTKHSTHLDADYMQVLIDQEGKELRPLRPGEIYHAFTVICRPGRVVLHPKGSMLATEYGSHYFQAPDIQFI